MLKIINSRVSVRKFKETAVSKEDIKKILEAAMNAPSGGNEQAWQFIVIEGEMMAKLVEFNTNSPKNAPIGILVCSDLSKEKYQGLSVMDCSAATQNILLSAHSMGMGGVWTAVFPPNASSIQKLLNLPEKVVPFSYIPIGYPSEKTENKESRYNEDNVHWNKW